GAPWKSGSFEGAGFVAVGHRIFDRCTGEVFGSKPPSKGPVSVVKDASCPVELTAEEQRAEADAELPEQLSAQQVSEVLSPCKDPVHTGGVEFEVPGTALLKLNVDREGKVVSLGLGPIEREPVGYCIKTALKGLHFPRFRGEKMIISFSYQLQ